MPWHWRLTLQLLIESPNVIASVPLNLPRAIVICLRQSILQRGIGRRQSIKGWNYSELKGLGSLVKIW